MLGGKWGEDGSGSKHLACVLCPEYGLLALEGSPEGSTLCSSLSCKHVEDEAMWANPPSRVVPDDWDWS